MKKNIILLILTYIFCNFAFMNRVEAVYAINNTLGYDVESFSIVGDANSRKMRISGWAFIDHADNYGILPGSSVGNLTTYVVAYVGNWNNNVLKNGSLEIGDINNCINMGGTNKNCMAFKTTAINRNLYTTRCIMNGCKNSVQNKVESLTAGGRYILDKCVNEKLTISTNFKLSSEDSHCVYKNVGFTVDIGLNSIYKNFLDVENGSFLGGNDTISFKLVSRLTQLQKGNTKNIEAMQSADFGVSNSAVSSSLTSAGDGNYNISTSFNYQGEYTVVNYNTIKLGGISNKFLFTSGRAKGRTDQKMTVADDHYLWTNGLFDIDTSFSSDTSGFKYTKGKSISNIEYRKYLPNGYDNRKINIRVYAVKRAKTAVKNPNQGNALQYKPGTYKRVFIPAAWGRVEGKFSLKYSEGYTSTPIHSCACLGGNCRGNDSCNKIVATPKSCSGDETISLCKNGKKTDDSVFSCDNTISSSNYYYKISSNNLLKRLKEGSTTIRQGLARGNTIEIITGADSVAHGVLSNTESGVVYYYIPITFHSNISYNQKSNVVMNDNFVNGASVNAGRFFEFGLKYNVDAYWNYLTYNFLESKFKSDDISESANLNNWYTNLKYIGFRFRSSTGTYGTNQSIGIYFDLKRLDDIYTLENINGVKSFQKFVSGGVNGYSSAIYTDVVQKKNIVETWENKISNNEVMLEGAFPDSNDINVTDKNNPGSFKCVQNASSTNGNAGIVFDCEYRISTAYLDSKDGKVYYYREGEEIPTEYIKMHNLDSNGNYGNLFYIPYNMKDTDTFYFDIKSTKLSLIDGFALNYDDTCSVGAKKIRLKYRPINTLDPFPKAEAPYNDSDNKIASNWKKYYDENGNFTRIIDKSYSNISYRTLFFENSVINRISKFNLNINGSGYGGYGDNGDMTIDGESNVIKNENIFEIDNGEHCASAKYDVSCDRVQ